MARKNDIVETEEELDLDLDDLDFDDEVTEEEEPAQIPKAKPKRTPKDDSGYVKASDVAKMFDVSPMVFRAHLRKTYPEHKKGTLWRWKKDSEELQEVIDTYKVKNSPKE